MILEIRRRLARQPFSPFTIYLADGRTLDVPHPEFLWVTNSGHLYHMHGSDPAGERLNSLLIVSVATTEAPRKRSRR